MAKKYDLYIRIEGHGTKFEGRGKVDLNGLEKLLGAVKSPKTQSGKKDLTRDIWERYQKHDYDWFASRYNCTKQQIAAYKAWKTREGE